MKYLIPPLVLAVSTLIPCAAFSIDRPDLKPYPPPGDGMVRFVITLPPLEDNEEELAKVELVTGKEMLTDGVNRYRLGARLEPRDVPGWGYTLYESSPSPHVASTLMAPPPGTVPQMRFVHGAPLLIDYNSRLPIVIHVPVDQTVRYRIWTAGTPLLPADN